MKRRHITELLYEPPSKLTPRKRVNYHTKVINTLVSLCQKQKRPSQAKKWTQPRLGYSTYSQPTLKASLEPVLAAIIITNNECIFRVYKTGQSRPFYRAQKAREHVKCQHLVFFGQDDLIPYLDPYCRLSGVVLFSHLHFKNHVSKVHGCSVVIHLEIEPIA